MDSVSALSQRDMVLYKTGKQGEVPVFPLKSHHERPPGQVFGSAGLAYATAALTLTTLFFGELLPKALGVSNAEAVARRTVPIIILISAVLNPLAKSITVLSKVRHAHGRS